MREYVLQYFIDDDSPALGARNLSNPRDVFLGGDRGRRRRLESTQENLRGATVSSGDALMDFLSDVASSSKTLDELIEAIISRSHHAYNHLPDSYVYTSSSDFKFNLNSDSLNRIVARLRPFLTADEMLRLIEGLASVSTGLSRWFVSMFADREDLFIPVLADRLLEKTALGEFYRISILQQISVNDEETTENVFECIRIAIERLFRQTATELTTYVADAPNNSNLQLALEETLDMLTSMVEFYCSTCQSKNHLVSLVDSIYKLLEAKRVSQDSVAGVVDDQLNSVVSKLIQLYTILSRRELTSPEASTNSETATITSRFFIDLLSSLTSLEKIHQLNPTALCLTLQTIQDEERSLLRERVVTTDDITFIPEMKNLILFALLSYDNEPEHDLLFSLLSDRLSTHELQSTMSNFDENQNVRLLTQDQLLLLYQQKKIDLHSRFQYVSLIQHFMQYVGLRQEWAPILLEVVTVWHRDAIESVYRDRYDIEKTESIPDTATSEKVLRDESAWQEPFQIHQVLLSLIRHLDNRSDLTDQTIYAELLTVSPALAHFYRNNQHQGK